MAYSAVLTWDASIDPVDGYNVYRAVNAPGQEGGTPLNSGLLQVTTFTDTTVLPGQTLDYVVTALKNGIESVISNEIVISIPSGASSFVVTDEVFAELLHSAAHAARSVITSLSFSESPARGTARIRSGSSVSNSFSDSASGVVAIIAPHATTSTVFSDSIVVVVSTKIANAADSFVWSDSNTVVVSTKIADTSDSFVYGEVLVSFVGARFSSSVEDDFQFNDASFALVTPFGTGGSPNIPSVIQPWLVQYPVTMLVDVMNNVFYPIGIRQGAATLLITLYNAPTINGLLKRQLTDVITRMEAENSEFLILVDNVPS